MRRQVLWASGVLDLVLGVFLFAFPPAIVNLAGLPIAFPSVYLALGGAAFLGLAAAKIREATARGDGTPLLFGTVVTESLALVSVFAWALSGQLDLPVEGWVLYWASAAVGLASGLASLVALLVPAGAAA